MRATTPAVAYYRMSTKKQDTSIADQRSAVEKYATENNFRIIRDYIDEGISGDNTKKRKDFLQMMDDAITLADFQAILCWDQDRFGRFDSVESGFWVHPLRNVGVRLETVCQGVIDWNSFMGRMMYTYQQENKHDFLVSLARNTTRGVLAKAKTGVWPGGRIPYGYQQEEKGGPIVPGPPEQVEAVRRIFELRITGMGYRTIARQVNAEGISSPSGGTWSHDSVRIVLNREAYIGTLVFGGSSQGKHMVTNRGEMEEAVPGQRRKTEPLRVENAHKAIISNETWRKSQAVKAKPFSKREGKGSPLAGLLYCGECGSAMYSQSLQRAAGQRNPVYVCSCYHKGKGCGYCYVPQDAMLGAVSDALASKFLNLPRKELVKRVEQAVALRLKSNGADTKRKRLEATIDRREGQIKRANKRIVAVDDCYLDEVLEDLKGLKDLQQADTEELAAMNPQKPPQIDAEKIADKAWELGKVLKEGEPRAVNQALKGFVERIDLDFEKMPKNGRGQPYRCTGATMQLCTKEWAYGESCR